MADVAEIVDEAAVGVVGAVGDAAARHLGSVPRSLPPHPCPDSATEAAEVHLSVGKDHPEEAEEEADTAVEEVDTAAVGLAEEVEEAHAVAAEARPLGSSTRERLRSSTRA